MRKIKDTDFVIAWQESDSMNQFIEKIKEPRSSAQQHATRLRKLGVPLQKFRRIWLSAVEIAALKKLAEKIAGLRKL